MIQKVFNLQLKNTNTLDYTIVMLIVSLVFIGCKSASVNYDKKIKKFLDNNKIMYKIDNEGDFIVNKNINSLDTEIIIRSNLNTYNKSKTREIFGIVGVFDTNTKTIGEMTESLMIDSYNNRVMGSWEIIHDADKGNNSLIYIVKVEENSSDTFLLDTIEEIASTITIFKKIIKSNGKVIQGATIPLDDNTIPITNDESKIKETVEKSLKEESEYSEEELQEIKAQ